MMRNKEIPIKAESVEEACAIFEKHKDDVFQQTLSQLTNDVEAGKRIVLVYQMGKVGSTSYTQSLENIDELSVTHIHRMNTKDNERMISHFLRNRMTRLAIKERRWQAVFEFVKSHSRPIYILSAMRNPIDRNISAFFQNLQLQESDDAEVLIKRFLATYPHDIPKNWFREQFHDALGIDIFNYPFNKERGWDAFQHKNYNCLLMTAEINDTEKTEAINSFLDTRLSNIERRNIGASKDYSSLYGKFKGEIELPESFVDSQLKNEVVSYFYTSEKISEFKSKWA